MTLCRDWDYRPLAGWFWSEKFDGVRAYWDGFNLWTRGGRIITAPSDFIAKLPVGVALDGELWAGYGTLTVAANAAVHGIWDSRLVLKAFDAPDARGNWLERMKVVYGYANAVIQPVARGVVGYGEFAACEIAEAVIARGGEGAMFRNPAVQIYETKRTVNIQRIKAHNVCPPWRKEAGSRSAKIKGAVRVLGETGNRSGNQKRGGKIQASRIPLGFDVRLMPVNPRVEWHIKQILGDCDYHDLNLS